MSFQNLKVDELKELAAFFAVEPKVADAEHGPTKKELLAALAEDEVSKEDYDTFLEAKAAGTDKTAEEKREEAAAAAAAAEEEADATAESEDEVEADATEAVEVVEEQDEDESEQVLVKYERKNPTWEVGGYRFTKAHPFKSVPVETAESLIKGDKTGFRLALPSEVKDYYN